MIYLSIVLALVALMELAILVKIASIVECVERIRTQVLKVPWDLQVLDHKVSKSIGVTDGDEEYLEELLQNQSDFIGD